MRENENVFVVIVLGAWVGLMYFSPFAFLLFICIIWIGTDKYFRILFFIVAGLFFIALVLNVATAKDIIINHHRFFSAYALYKYPIFNVVTVLESSTAQQAVTYFILPIFCTSLFSYVCFCVLVLLKQLADPKRKLIKTIKLYKSDFKKAETTRLNPNNKNVVLGVDIVKNGKDIVSIPFRFLNRHTCLVGTTGSGKTVTLYNFIISSLLHKKPLIFVDGKGDVSNIEKFRQYCERFGRAYRVITLSKSDRYNPFGAGTPTELTDKLISMFDWSEDYYRQNSYEFTQLLIKLLQSQKIPVTLSSIVYYSNLNNITLQKQEQKKTEAQNNKDELNFGFEASNEMIMQQNKERLLYARIKSIDYKSINGFISKISNLTESDFGEIFENNNFNVDTAIQCNEAVLFSLDSLRYPEQTKAIGRLIINDIKTAVSRHQNRKVGAVSIFFDEFNVFASHQVVDVINKSRSAGFEAVISFQSLSDIDKLKDGQALRRQIIQNCNNLIVHKQNDSHDAEELSTLFGTRQTINETIQTDEGRSTGMRSMKGVREFNVHPDIIKVLNAGEAYVKIDNESYRIQVIDN